ncbi:MAG: ATP-binding protein, partial [Myxococcota bacterium]
MEPTHPTDPPASERATPALAPIERRPFFGRERELAALRSALGRARHAPVVRVLDAPTGVGKSTLLRRFLRDLPAGTLVLRGRCYERDGGALDGVVEALGRHVEALPADARDALARLFPALGGTEGALPPVDTDPAEVRRRGVEALRALLGHLAEQGPVVLALDEVQWSDADGAALLHALCRGPDAP